jgi:hypothetical protein
MRADAPPAGFRVCDQSHARRAPIDDAAPIELH